MAGLPLSVSSPTATNPLRSSTLCEAGLSIVTLARSPVSPYCATRVGSLLGEFVGATGIEDGGELAAGLAELRLPVFGSQPRDSKPLKDLVEDAGDALMFIGVLAGTHAPALLVLTGPVGAIITLGTYATLGGAWAINRVRQRRAAQREAEAVRAAADAATAAAEATAATVAALHATAAGAGIWPGPRACERPGLSRAAGRAAR
jgi:hypothetical protein